MRDVKDLYGEIAAHKAALKKTRIIAARLTKRFMVHPRRYVGKIVDISHVMGFHIDAIRACEHGLKRLKSGGKK